VPWDAISAIGSIFGGLAIVLAFIQLGALRQDRLRAQVSKIGAWADTPETPHNKPIGGEWAFTINVRNSSELPAAIDSAELSIRSLLYVPGPARPEGSGKADYYTEKRLGDPHVRYFAPGTIAPGDTWTELHAYRPDRRYDLNLIMPPKVSVSRVVITDAAGHQWEIRSAKAGPPRRVLWWRRWWWKRHGKL
jgi:hypothetical protein